MAQTQTHVCSLSISQTSATTWQVAVERQQRPVLFSTEHKEQKWSKNIMLPVSASSRDQEQRLHTTLCTFQQTDKPANCQHTAHTRDILVELQTQNKAETMAQFG
jgi:hypothetical protein